MIVTFISQCEKNALKKTRRVLDSFANRIGDNTWQTIITMEGLKAVKKLLRKTASKSTAVSCHWVRSSRRVELMWIVGNRDRFNGEGIVPVNRTQKTILDNYKESDWKYLPLIKSLVALSALLHDWGKATQLFQEKLKSSTKKGDPIRHEWISCMLLNAFITQNSENWLERLANGEIEEETLKENIKALDSKVLKNLPNSAKLIMWLIVSHHRLPLELENIEDWQDEEADTIDDILKYVTKEWGYENSYDEDEERLKQCFIFPKGLLSNANRWLKELKKWSNRMSKEMDLLNESMSDGSYRIVLHYARLTLMLGDHNYSSQDRDENWNENIGLFANTDQKRKKMKQKLDEHLCGVMKQALQTVHYLPAFEKEFECVKDNRALKRASPKAFSWQDKAVKKIEPIFDTDVRQGFFAVNMASTGCGKTFANAKIMRAVSEDKKSLRYILALGLRTLTLQTGREYKEKIKLEEDELAVLIGSKAVKELHDEQIKEESYEDYGSESEEALLDEEIEYDFPMPTEGLSTLLRREKYKAFLHAPLLVCTIDHIMGAVTTKRGGKYILPSLRLMSSDLVIDEIDDFTGSDLIAIGRLVHLAGMLGRKVMISSATIPPDLAEGYFNAYKKGWQLFCKTREAKEEIVTAWIDEFQTKAVVINAFKSNSAIEEYANYHSSFIDKRVAKLAKEMVKRKVDIVACKDEIGGDDSLYFSKIKDALIQKHREHNSVDKETNINVSFGVVRMANIQPCVALSKFLMLAEYPSDIEVRVMSYHSNQVLLLRHEQEKHLDEVLNRKGENEKEAITFTNAILRSHLDGCFSKNMIFIVVATPVEEVGRDHDFDWAVIEPSSFRSIIQMAGRVRRHRIEVVDKPNIALMQYNLKSFRVNDDTIRSFNRPGYEIDFTLKSHNISELIDVKQVEKCLDATLRIKKPKKLNEKGSLSDLEHFMTERDLTDYEGVEADTFQGYLEGSHFLTAHPQYFHPFRKSSPSMNVFLVYDENIDGYIFTEYDKFGKIIVDISDNPMDRGEVLRIKKVEADEFFNQRAWLQRDYNVLIEQQAIKRDLSKYDVSLKFGELSFNAYEDSSYEYSNMFGLVKV